MENKNLEKVVGYKIVLISPTENSYEVYECEYTNQIFLNKEKAKKYANELNEKFYPNRTSTYDNHYSIKEVEIVY